jgi:hypothetical protein
MDRSFLKVEVASPEFKNLAEAESAPRCYQDGCLQGLGSGFNEACNFRNRYGSNLPPSASDTSAPDRARIGPIEGPLRERLLEDGFEQRVGMRALGLPVLRQVDVPPIHVH